MAARGKTQALDEDEVFSRIAEGESLNAIAKSLKISESALREWTGKTEERSAKYARARELRAHVFAERIVSLANDTVQGTVRPEAARVAIDALKWTASKMLPKVYGDRQQLDVDARVKTVREMTEDELVAIAAGAVTK